MGGRRMLGNAARAARTARHGCGRSARRGGCPPWARLRASEKLLAACVQRTRRARRRRLASSLLDEPARVATEFHGALLLQALELTRLDRPCDHPIGEL